jgi:hypothetical protein
MLGVQGGSSESLLELRKEGAKSAKGKFVDLLFMELFHLIQFVRLENTN